MTSIGDSYMKALFPLTKKKGGASVKGERFALILKDFFKFLCPNISFIAPSVS